MKEHADKLKDSDKEPLQTAIEKTRETAKGDDAEAIKSAINELEQASHALSKVLYEAGQADAAAQEATSEPPSGDGGDGGDGGEGGDDDDAIDAEFEVKKDTKRSEYKDKHYVFCCSGCKPMFDENPEKYLKKKKKK